VRAQRAHDVALELALEAVQPDPAQVRRGVGGSVDEAQH
jgi:hypothetical protein